ncbi:MAG: beta-ketoacyl-ACP synthase II [Deltaproteobacteria bacterium]|nr:beta-ketoacyl-ACP synthase II [Deltaproteobacteria bacterium]
MSRKNRRVVVTGLGAVTPLGNSIAETWEGICRGRSGISTIAQFDTSGYKTTIAGEVKGFDPLNFMDAKEVRRVDPFIIFALAAAEMALKDAALAIDSTVAERAGVILGSGIGGLRTIEREVGALNTAGPKRISPFAIPALLANLAPGNIAIRFGLKGPISSVSTACSAGNNAIHDAYRQIIDDCADIMVTGGAEAAVRPIAIAGFNAMRALSTRNDEPQRASRPFDRDRDGFVIGEGAGILILEELERAMNRGARIYAEMIGAACTSDAYHIAAPPPGHEGAARCMALAIKAAGCSPEEIDYINAHGTSTIPNDLCETQAIERVFGVHAQRLAVSSTKSMTGHLLGATGGVEAAITVLALHHGMLPPTINLDNRDPACTLDYVPHHARKRSIRTAMSNTFGFGGVNAVSVFRTFNSKG